MPRLQALAGWTLLPLLLACGGREQALSAYPDDAGASAAEAGAAGLHDAADGPLYERSYEVIASEGTLQCLEGTVLDLGAAQVPNCFVVLARFPRDGGSPGDLAACEQCSEPGLAPFVPSVPLEDIGQGLSCLLYTSRCV